VKHLLTALVILIAQAVSVNPLVGLWESDVKSKGGIGAALEFRSDGTYTQATKLNPEEATTVMLQAAWLPNAIFCAIGFWGDRWQIGAYLAAFTIVLYTVEITLSTLRNRRTPCLENARPKNGILSDGERPLSVSG